MTTNIILLVFFSYFNSKLYFKDLILNFIICFYYENFDSGYTTSLWNIFIGSDHQTFYYVYIWVF